MCTSKCVHPLHKVYLPVVAIFPRWPVFQLIMKTRYQAFPSNEILDNLKFKEAQGYLSWGRMDPNKWIPSKILWWNYLAKVINNKGGHKSNEHCRACMFPKAECVYLQNKIETLIKNKKCWLFHPKSFPVISIST